MEHTMVIMLRGMCCNKVCFYLTHRLTSVWSCDASSVQLCPTILSPLAFQRNSLVEDNASAILATVSTATVTVRQHGGMMPNGLSPLLHKGLFLTGDGLRKKCFYLIQLYDCLASFQSICLKSVCHKIYKQWTGWPQETPFSGNVKHSHVGPSIVVQLWTLYLWVLIRMQNTMWSCSNLPTCMHYK